MISDLDVRRVYKCHEQDCGGLFAIVQKATDNFLVECPFCEKESLLIETGSLSIETCVKVDSSVTRQAERQEKRENWQKNRNIRKPSTEKPWWRDGEINFDILKNPRGYILNGDT
jgi:hypothetical protein